MLSSDMISINTNGTITPEVSAPLLVGFGQQQYCWVDYNSSSEALEIRFSHSSVPPPPILIFGVNLFQFLGQTTMYLGFGAGAKNNSTDQYRIITWSVVVEGGRRSLIIFLLQLKTSFCSFPDALCPAMFEANAWWNKVEPGQVASGRCEQSYLVFDGYSATSLSPQRECLLSSNQTAIWGSNLGICERGSFILLSFHGEDLILNMEFGCSLLRETRVPQWQDV